MLESSLDGGSFCTVVSEIGECVPGCGRVRSQGGWLSACTHCCRAGEWSAPTVRGCPSFGLVCVSYLEECQCCRAYQIGGYRAKLRVLRCLVSVRISGDLRLEQLQSSREKLTRNAHQLCKFCTAPKCADPGMGLRPGEG